MAAGQGLGHVLHRCLNTSARVFASTRSDAPAALYKSTMSLPQTAFSLRAHAQEREPKFRRTTTGDLYRWQREHLQQDGQPDFVLHDGPPYANGGLHAGTSNTDAGHAINKILKDFILRFQVLQGRRVQ